ncbi:MAG: cytochrome c family protein [Alphaproteobacteria bacterium]|nr:cytochrome c family protein [Alphaproteobacteria bacterium]
MVSVVTNSAWAESGAVRGRQIYERCQGCHSIDRDRAGPRHRGLFGRRAGTVPGFAYSDAMRRSGIIWTAATLDRFLAAPTKAVPGTSMGFDGVKDPRERADLIAYLIGATEPR